MFIWYNGNETSLKNFYTWYGEGFESFEEFRQTLIKTTCPEDDERGHCMVFDMKRLTTNIYLKCFKWRPPADEPDPFMMGSEEFWRLADEIETAAPASGDGGMNLEQLLRQRNDMMSNPYASQYFAS